MLKFAKTIFSSDFDVVGWKTTAPYNSFLVRKFDSFDILVLFYDHFCLIKALSVGRYQISFATIENCHIEILVRNVPYGTKVRN